VSDSIRVGYINDDKQHMLLSIKNPTLTSQYPKPDIVQAAITIDEAVALQAALDVFLRKHRAGGVTSEMIEAGLPFLYRYHPEHGVGDEETVKGIFLAMVDASPPENGG
jgi:hypothetical protein